jgi:hypothetical protein
MRWMKSKSALAAVWLLMPSPGYPASGQLVLACKNKANAANVEEFARRTEDAFLVFDFDRDMLFNDSAARNAPITGIKMFFITWKSEDGMRSGYLNRVTLDAVEQDGTAQTSYSCALYAQLSFKAASR